MRRWLTVVVAGMAVGLSSRRRRLRHSGGRVLQGLSGTCESAFGNGPAPQSFGVEGGYALTPWVAIFGEGGRVMDAGPASVGNGAQIHRELPRGHSCQT